MCGDKEYRGNSTSNLAVNPSSSKHIHFVVVFKGYFAFPYIITRVK